MCSPGYPATVLEFISLSNFTSVMYKEKEIKVSRLLLSSGVYSHFFVSMMSLAKIWIFPKIQRELFSGSELFRHHFLASSKFWCNRRKMKNFTVSIGDQSFPLFGILIGKNIWRQIQCLNQNGCLMNIRDSLNKYLPSSQWNWQSRVFISMLHLMFDLTIKDDNVTICSPVLDWDHRTALCCPKTAFEGTCSMLPETILQAPPQKEESPQTCCQSSLPQVELVS